jgi:hypothetical protein
MTSELRRLLLSCFALLIVDIGAVSRATAPNSAPETAAESSATLPADAGRLKWRPAGPASPSSAQVHAELADRAKAYATFNPDAVETWIATLDQNGERVARIEFFKALTSKDPLDAFSRARRVSDLYLRVQFVGDALARIAKSNRDQAFGLLTQLDDPATVFGAKGSILYALTANDLEFVKTYVNNDADTVERKQLFIRLIDSVSDSRLADAAAWVSSVSWAPDDAVTAVAYRYARRDDQAALRWAATLQTAAQRDSAYESIAHEEAMRGLRAAFQTAQLIHDPACRKAAIADAGVFVRSVRP